MLKNEYKFLHNAIIATQKTQHLFGEKKYGSYNYFVLGLCIYRQTYVNLLSM